MVTQNKISPAAGSRHARKRVGRGTGSGHGAFSGRGCKGQKARAGNGKTIPGFEGGQLRLIKRLPKLRGFTNIFRTEYSLVSIDQLNKFKSGSKVTPKDLLEAGIIKSLARPIKILADGEIDHPITVQVDKISNSAKAKIEAAGGKVEEVTDATKVK